MTTSTSCICCEQEKEFFRTAYGTVLCEDCWDKYILTEHGKLEYLLGIVRAEYPSTEFDKDFLREAAYSWVNHRHELVEEVMLIDHFRCDTIALRILGIL